MRTHKYTLTQVARPYLGLLAIEETSLCECKLAGCARRSEFESENQHTIERAEAGHAQLQLVVAATVTYNTTF